MSEFKYTIRREKTSKWNESKEKHEKVSCGISCFKRIDGQMKILAICKRNSYAYRNFVHGGYSSNDNNEIIALLNGMTGEEKMTILSLEFKYLWYRIYLHSSRKIEEYAQLQLKFANAFVSDNGVRIKKLISQSTNLPNVWEIPKGRPSKEESDLECALREFTEETGLTKSQYTLIWRQPRLVSFEDAEVKYVYKYFMAFASGEVDLKIDSSFIEQACEIQDLRWVSFTEFKLLSQNEAVNKYVKQAFNFAKKKYPSSALDAKPKKYETLDKVVLLRPQ